MILEFAFDVSAGSYAPGPFLLALRIIESQLPTNLIVSFLPLKGLLLLELGKVFLFFRFISNSYFFKYLLNSPCLYRASSIYISRFLIPSRKATESLISLKSILYTATNDEFRVTIIFFLGN